MTENGQLDKKGPIAWMAGNPVAANLLMLIFLVGGLLMALQIKQEVFPEFSTDIVRISVPYPGASPEEVEQGIILALEEAVQGLEGIKEVVSTASEGSAQVSVEAMEGTDINRLWQEVQTEVDRVTTFPDEAEEPEVVIASHKRQVVFFALYGVDDERVLRNAAERVRDGLLLNPGITQVEIDGARDMEIHIDVQQDKLRRYDLTLQDLANRIRQASIELGAGTLETSGGDILVRVKDLRRTAAEYRQLPVIVDAEGGSITLEDLGTVREGFEDSDVWATYNGQKALMIEVYRVGDQTPVEVSELAQKAIAEQELSVPADLQLSLVRDRADIFSQRAKLLLKNAYLGLGLVFLLLTIFLELRLAFWVIMGIVISFLGAFLLLPLTSFSINMITMFAFIVTLGIVVDDAIVVGENIYYHRRQGSSSFAAALVGAREVAMPVTFSVLTNMIAFLPMFFIPGVMGKIFKFIPMVVVAVFLVSLIESLFILPAHLGHQRYSWKTGPFKLIARFQFRFSTFLENFIAYKFAPFLDFILRFRYTFLGLALALLLISLGYIQSGRMGMVLFPSVESDYAFAEAVLPYGSPASRINEVETRLIEAAQKVIEQNNGDGKLAKGIYSRINENNIQIRAFLTPPKVRPISTKAFSDAWRDKTGKIPGVETISFQSDRGGPGSGKDLTVQLSHRNQEILEQAGQALAEKIKDFAGVSDVDDGSAQGKRQYDIQVLAAGKRMDLSSRDVANQIRHALYGAEALKLQRGRNEVTVRIRLPKEERTREATLENLILQSPEGEILLREAARLSPNRAYTSIKRKDGRRVISVTANVRPRDKTEQLVNALKASTLPELTRSFSGLSYSFEGHQADIRESISSLISGLLMALLGIYALLAIPFRSYAQPLIIMVCIPFGLIGALVGHILLGYTLSVMSLFGVVALSGVVVNGSLVLIDFANRLRRTGVGPCEAVHRAALQRFRPILLTTLTTFGGLGPMILETSRQARFMIPMAISLGFGILFASMITLLLVPSLYMILEDVSYLLGFKKGRSAEVVQNN